MKLDTDWKFLLYISTRLDMCACLLGVPQGASVPAAGGEVDQYPDLGCHHHPEEHPRLPLQKELQVLQTESHCHPEPHPRTPGQVQKGEQREVTVFFLNTFHLFNDKTT